MNKVYLTIVFLFVFTLTFSQKMGNLYKYVIENNYKRLLNQKYISEKDTLYYFNSWNCKEDTSIFNYTLKIKNQYIQLKEPKVNEFKKTAIGNMLFAPEIENQYIVISFIDYGVYYKGKDDIRFINAGYISYFFVYNKEKKKYVFVKRKEYRI